jgi:hypothetical protein
MHRRQVGLPGSLALALGIVAAFAGCRTSGSPTLVEQPGEAPDSGPRVVVAPLNLAVELPADLEDAVPTVELAIIRNLQARGARVAVIWVPDAVALWRLALAAVTPTQSPAADLRSAMVKFTQRLAQSEKFDLMLFPTLALREAKVSGRRVRWDGVQRRLDFRQSDDASLPADTPVFGGEGVVAESEWKGRISALSLHVLALRPGSKRALERWGGLDLVHEAVPERGPSSSAMNPDLKLRRELLADPDYVDEGVKLALDGVWRSFAR